VSDRIRFTCNKNTFEACLSLAEQHGAGLEIQTFAHPDVLDNHWQAIVKGYLKRLEDFQGDISMHGAFYDLTSASPDQRVVRLAYDRYTHNLRIANMLGADYVVFHANYIASIRHPAYREQWTARQIEFWGRLVQEAELMGITILLENMWEYDPMIISNVLDAVNSPNLKSCIDVGHTQLYSDLVPANWVDILRRHLAYTHLNNNPGHWDEHCALGDGVIDYNAVLDVLRAVDPPVVMTLEMDNVEDIKRSLSFFDLSVAERRADPVKKAS
jgi:sugar phosphate isomerase/epimerase